MGCATVATLPAAVAPAEAFSGKNSLALIGDAYVGSFDPACGAMFYAMIGSAEFSQAGTHFLDPHMIFSRWRLDLQYLCEIAVSPDPGAFCEQLVIHIHAIAGRQTFPLAINIKKSLNKCCFHVIFTESNLESAMALNIEIYILWIWPIMSHNQNDFVWQRPFAEYHTKITDFTQQRLSAAGISYKFTDFNHLDHDLIYEEDLLIIISHDFLTEGMSQESDFRFTKKLAQLAKLARPVLIMTAVQNAFLDYDSISPNVHFLSYGSDILFQMNDYRKIQPQKNKNLNMSKFWLATCRAPRLHRMMTACWCLGTDLANGFEPETGTFRISFHEIAEFEDWRTYWLSCYPHAPQVTADQSEILQRGFDMVKQVIHGGQPEDDVYPSGVCDNARNFDQQLRVLYQESLIEIVLETTFFSRGIFITEKFLHSVYGYTMPIVISTPGAVAYLRTHGFDMFDDVIDHSYDLIEEPLQRIISAIDSNRRLLTDKHYAVNVWKNCLERLDSNVEFAQHKMYDHFASVYASSLDEYLSTTWIRG